MLSSNVPFLKWAFGNIVLSVMWRLSTSYVVSRTHLGRDAHCAQTGQTWPGCPARWISWAGPGWPRGSWCVSWCAGAWLCPWASRRKCAASGRSQLPFYCGQGSPERTEPFWVEARTQGAPASDGPWWNLCTSHLCSVEEKEDTLHLNRSAFMNVSGGLEKIIV